jgi:hypothetical protein
MITIPIYIYDASKKEKIEAMEKENDILGFKKNEIQTMNIYNFRLTDFRCDENKISGFWIDPDRDDDTGTFDIIFYFDGTSFRTPYSDKVEEYLINLLKERK